MIVQSAADYLMVGPVGKLDESVIGAEIEMYSPEDKTETKPAGKRNCKRVTFRKDCELVSIREISPRRNKSDSSDNGEASGSSSEGDSSDSDSSSSECDSSEEEGDDDDDDNANLMKKMSKLVLKHTRSKPQKKDVLPRTIPARPPRLRRPRPPKAATVKCVPEKFIVTSSVSQNKNELAKPKPPTSLATRKFGRILHHRRPRSCTDTRDILKQRPSSPVINRASSAKPSLSLTSRSHSSDNMIRRGSISNYSSQFYRVPPQSERYNAVDSNNNMNSGQERTKFYAWQVANGAPLITTPGIAPMYTEQVTLTRL